MFHDTFSVFHTKCFKLDSFLSETSDWPLTCWKYQLQMTRQSEPRMLYKQSLWDTLYSVHISRAQQVTLSLHVATLNR